MSQSFPDWIAEVKMRARDMGWAESWVRSLDEEAWKVYYEEGLTAKEALIEEDNNG